MDYESVLLVKNEVFVYQIPPRQSNRGYRANDWNLEAPMWTGRLRVVAKGKDLVIRLEDKNSGQLYAKCPVDSFPGIAVEPVLDSSRYFVIRLMNDDGRTVFIGIGFSERADSFDLNVAIQDHFKWLKQEKEAKEMEEKSADQPAKDLGFKQGEKIKLNLNTRRTGDDPIPKSKVSRPLGSGLPGGLLPPPPPPAVSRSRGSRTIGDTTVATAPVSTNLFNNDSSSLDYTDSVCASNVPKTISSVDLLSDFLGDSGQF
ncbi:NECAP-like protein isoform 3 [Schistosoma japonicum]|uniref:NECAP-like protein CG9132 n=2 Tax=Schistosoma japonicum TaxID=6182 RepID=C1L6R1_SCHJA|nr:NECAP-like protein [Schistosoma japonicum]KAH8852171.1 NECAP-like protein [Schistosoma japonicum]TNN15273.1 NECAP-like protein isoform 3 [Schistosoma japonicum]CAX70388.1 NECAP-like protein CG9132 [Schistosoma japonicum]CAX70389.1 NECAP-like protein CG9132 [Schistosoma japonicum]